MRCKGCQQQFFSDDLDSDGLCVVCFDNGVDIETDTKKEKRAIHKREKQRKYYLKNRKRIIARNRAYALANPERTAKWQKDYKEKNKYKIRARMAIYAKTPEEKARRKKYYVKYYAKKKAAKKANSESTPSNVHREIPKV